MAKEKTDIPEVEDQAKKAKSKKVFTALEHIFSGKEP